MRQMPTVLVAAFAATTALAGPDRDLGAHVHGQGSLDIAFEGGSVALAFEAPGADIVGFEHAAESEADRAAVAAATEALADPFAVIAFPEAAGCAATDAMVRLVSNGDDEHDDHAGAGHQGHDDHGHEDHAEAGDHGHDDHAEAGDHGHDDHADADGHGHEEHAEGGDHAHDDHAEGAAHSAFRAEYTLSCADPAAIDALSFPYFERFGGAESLRVQVVSGSGARAFDVDRTAPRIDLGGAI